MKLTLCLAATLALLITAPTNSSAIFDGIPFTKIGELGFIIGLSFVLLVSTLRRELVRRVAHLQARTQKTMFLMLGLAIAIKVAVFIVHPTAGHFESCFRHFNARSGVECSSTFEPHPRLASHSEQFVRRSSDTRFVDFGPRTDENQGVSGSSWRLPFVNDGEFDRGFWSWEPQQKAIETFPFWAEFRGVANTDNGDQVRVSYIGQGRLFIDDEEYSLSPSYGAVSVFISPPVTRQAEINIDYAYLATRLNSDESVPPYAVLRVEKLSERGSEPLSASMPGSLKLVNLLTDAIIGLSIASIGWLLRNRISLLVLSGLLAAVQWVLLQREVTVGFGRLEIELAIPILICGFILLRNRQNINELLAPSIIATGFGLTMQEIYGSTGLRPQLSDVLVRLRGNDHLVYHSLAREMLDSGFLRGGEEVYYFQPGIRYVYFALQYVFGESGVLTGAISVVLIGLGILYVARQLPWGTSLGRTLIQIVAIGSLIVWWSSSHTVQSAIFGLSEFGTWILLLVAFGILLKPNADYRLFLLGLSLGWIVWIRPNQGVAVIAMLILAVAVYVQRGFGWRSAGTWLGFPFAIVIALLPLHNLLYGRTFQLLPGGHLNARQAGWDSVLKAFGDEESRSFIRAQIEGILYFPNVLPDIYSFRLALAVVGFGIVVAAAIIAGVMHWPQQRRLVTLSLLVVLGQTFPFINYTIYRYFPIHNIAIYLTAVLASLLIIARAESIRPQPLAPQRLSGSLDRVSE